MHSTRTSPPQALQLPSHIVCCPASDARIHLVKDDGACTARADRQAAQRQHYARQLSPYAMRRERPELCTWVRRHEELRPVHAAAAPPSLRRGRVVEPHRQSCPRHGKLTKALFEGGSEPIGCRPA